MSEFLYNWNFRMSIVLEKEVEDLEDSGMFFCKLLSAPCTLWSWLTDVCKQTDQIIDPKSVEF
jgi:hypothetical protein